MPSYLVKEEDGTSKYILEDSSGDILLEESVPASGAVTFDDTATLLAVHISQ